VDVLQCAVKFLAAVFKALNKKPPASVTWLTKGWLRNFGRDMSKKIKEEADWAFLA